MGAGSPLEQVQDGAADWPVHCGLGALALENGVGRAVPLARNRV